MKFLVKSFWLPPKKEDEATICLQGEIDGKSVDMIMFCDYRDRKYFVEKFEEVLDHEDKCLLYS